MLEAYSGRTGRAQILKARTAVTVVALPKIWIKCPRSTRRCLRAVTDRRLPGQGTTQQPGFLRKGLHPMNLFVLRTWLEAKFAKDERGASMVEYILLVALIALAVIAAVVFLKDQVNNKFNDAGSKLSSSGYLI